MRRFDVAAAMAVLCWDYGLYGAWADMQSRWKYKPAPSLCWDTLTDEQRTIYYQLQDRAVQTSPYDTRLQRIED